MSKGKTDIHSKQLWIKGENKRLSVMRKPVIA